MKTKTKPYDFQENYTQLYACTSMCVSSWIQREMYCAQLLKQKLNFKVKQKNAFNVFNVNRIEIISISCYPLRNRTGEGILNISCNHLAFFFLLTPLKNCFFFIVVVVIFEIKKNFGYCFFWLFKCKQRNFRINSN